MNILEQIYEINFNKINFNERKIRIEYKNTILIGPPKCGKSYLIYDYLSNYSKEQYLYIDCNDYKNDLDEISKYLDEFIKIKNIEVLVLENFKFNLELPLGVESIIISTSLENSLEGFEKVFVDELDFEEYLLFDNKHQSSSNSFNSFLKFGNFPEIIEYSEQKKANRNYEIVQLYCDDKIQLQVLLLLIKNSGEKKSIFQLFNVLKKEIKISKDRFYKICESFVFNRVVFFCEKYQQPKAVKKIFVHNHGLLDLVSYKKNFNNLFKNMIYLELHKRYKELYYLDNIDFYLPQTNEIVLAIPFFNNFLSSNIIEKIIPSISNYKLKSITIVTISSEESIFITDLEAQIVPFNSWAVSL